MRLRLLSPSVLLPIVALWWLLSAPVPTEYFVRPNGGTTTQCTGTTNADYPGTGTAQPCAFRNLQDGFDTVQFGDTLTLLQGATFTAPGLSSAYRLRPKSGGTGTDADYITVRTSGFASLPSGRVSDGTAMAKIVALGTGGAIITNEDNVRYWKFVGIEITNQSSGTASEHAYTLVDLGQSGLTPNHFWFDHCYVHPQEDGTNNYYRSSTRGFGVNNVNVFKLTKSRVSGFLGRYAHDHNDLIDSEAFSTASVGTNYLIDDNYLQAYFNTFFLGGGSIAPTTNTGVVQASPAPTLTSCALSTVANLSIGDYISFPQPNGARNANAQITNISGTTITYTTLDLYSESLGQRIQATAPAAGAAARWGPNSNSPIDNITITHNTFDLPTAYCQWEYDQTNGVRMPKGFFEIKWADHLLVEGNIFQGWPSWFAINAVNQTGNSPWLTVRNAIFRSNWIRQFAIGSLNHSFGNPLGQADWHMTQRGSNITYDNNLFTEDSPFPIDLGGWGPRVMQQGWGPDGLTITHNTWVNNSLENVATWAASGPTANFTFRDNIAYYNNYGIGCSYGAQTFAACWPAWTETKNAIVNVRGDTPATFPNSYSVTPATNPVGWVGPLNNSQIAGWTLSVSSPYHNKGSDGTDPGVNVPVLLTAIGGQPAPTPTPTPTFTISGTITLNGSGLGNTTVNLLRSSDRVILSATTTSSDGGYGLNGAANSSVVVVPVKSGYLFIPSEVLISPLNSNRTQSFTASAPSPTPTPTATPTPTPTATPTPTVTPTPTPTPPPPSPTPTPTPGVLPICGPNQVIGSPAVCRCFPIPPRKVIGNPRRCKP